MSEQENPQEAIADPAEIVPPASGLPDWAATSLVGIILAVGVTVLIAQLRPVAPPAQARAFAPRLVSIAEAEAAKSTLQKSGMQFVESDQGLQLVPLSAEPLPVDIAPPAYSVVASSPLPSAMPEAPIATGVLQATQKVVGPVPLQTRARIAIVIDDLGLRQNASLRATELPGPLTLAFLPYGENLQALSDNARAGGHEVIVHMPMQGAITNDPGPKALIPGLSAVELSERLKWNLSRFTGYTGINNHMGSKFTENAEGMKLVYTELASRNLFYLDSRTTAKSAARQLALEDKIPYAERDVFLDNTQDARYVAVQLAEAEKLARRYGTAIAIGHPHDVTLETLARWIPTLAAKGIDLVPVSRIISDRATPMWRLAVYDVKRDG
jgi:uncharacterized protein